MLSCKPIFVVGHLNLHDGELTQEVIYGTESKVEALNKFLETDFENMEQINEYCSNGDSYINALEL